MNDTNKNEPQQQEQKFNKIISNILTIIGLILIAASPIQLIILLLANSEVKYPNLIIAVLLFIGGYALLRTTTNNISQNTTGKGSGDANAIFSTQHILIGVTIFNIVLFVGGTILADLKVDSIQEKYDKAIETVNRTEKKYNDAEAKLLEMENRTILRIGKITEDVEKKKKRGCEEIEAVVKQVKPLKEKIKTTKINLDTLNEDLEFLGKELEELKKTTSQKVAIAKEYTLLDVNEIGTSKSGLLNVRKGETKAGIPTIIFLLMIPGALIGVLYYFKFRKKGRTLE